MVSFIFRINELRESGAFAPAQDINGQWEPTDARGANAIVAGGATNIWWHCDGRNIRALTNESNLPARATRYKTYSMYYSHAKGFRVLRDDAVTTRREEGWLPLTFEHDTNDNYSSFLNNAKLEPTLYCYRQDEKWVRMLLPDNYHGRWVVPAPYGGLKGELGIFLALIAFAIPMDGLQQYLPSMFHSGQWQQYEMANGRDDKRGVVVEVRLDPSRGGSTADQLYDFEERGKYYT